MELPFNNPCTDSTPEPSKECDKKTRIIVNYMLFKPPKNDTNYFHFTEVESDWIQLKR
jgi:hypothetical protein